MWPEGCCPPASLPLPRVVGRHRDLTPWPAPSTVTVMWFLLLEDGCFVPPATGTPCAEAPEAGGARPLGTWDAGTVPDGPVRDGRPAATKGGASALLLPVAWLPTPDAAVTATRVPAPGVVSLPPAPLPTLRASTATPVAPVRGGSEGAACGDDRDGTPLGPTPQSMGTPGSGPAAPVPASCCATAASAAVRAAGSMSSPCGVNQCGHMVTSEVYRRATPDRNFENFLTCAAGVPHKASQGHVHKVVTAGPGLGMSGPLGILPAG